MMRKKLILFSALLLSVITALSACGKKEETETSLSARVFPPNITSYYTNDAGESVLDAPSPTGFYFEESAANVDLLNKELTSISVSPKADGVWQWNNEYSLVFIPKQDWPAGETYKITLPKEIFSPSYKAKQYSYEVQTPKFRVELTDFRLYQNPKNPRTHQLQAEFSFTHPVDDKNFEQNLSFKINNKKFPFSVTYDAIKRRAFVVSQQITILPKSQTAVIELDEAKTTNGGKPFKEKLKGEVDIPSQDKFFKISNVSSRIVNNDKEEPEQFIEISFTDGVDAKELYDKVEAYLLPIYKSNEDARRGEIYDDEDVFEGYYDSNGSWVEPQRYRRPYSYKWKFAEITPEVLSLSQKLDLKQVETADAINGSYMFKYRAADMAARYLFVRVKGEIKSQIDFVIKNPSEYLIRSAGFPKEVQFLQNGAILPLEGSRELTFKTRGVSGVKVKLARVMPQQINHLISQTYGSFTNPHFVNYSFDQSNISQSFEKSVQLTAGIEKANYSSVNMEEFLKSRDSSGLFFVQITGWNPKTGNSEGIYDKRFILVTDLALLVKKDSSDRHSVFVMSIKDGLPVSGAKVEILGKNGLPVLTSRTNEEGYAQFDKIDGYNNEKQPVAYIVSRGNDISFMPFLRNDREVNFSKFDISGQHSSSKDDRLKAFIFSDRGIYRPGDEMNFAMIVKDDKWGDASGVPIQFELEDPSGKVIFKKTVALNSSGFFTVDAIKTSEVSPTGSYSANAYIAHSFDSFSFIGNTHVKVEEFRTDAIKVNAKITGASGLGWTVPEDLKGFVYASNFFGTPSQEQTVEASYSLSPAQFKFSKYSGFIFQDPYKLNNRNAIKSVDETFPKTKTDERGEASFDIDLSKYSGGTYNLSFYAQVYEAGSGKSVLAYASARVSPYKYLVGYKTDSNLSYLNKSSEASVELIAVDNDLNQIELKNLKLKLLQRQHISSLVKQDDGAYKYQSSVKDALISETPFVLNKANAKLPLDSANPGNYVVELEDETGAKILSFGYFVAGSSNQSLSIEKDANLTLNLESDDVEPGGRLKLNITAPYTGSGLITIEREKVYAYKWFKTNSNSSIQTITVPENIEGDAYVVVSFIRSQDSKEIFSSPHSYAAVPFKISLAKRVLQIDLKAPQVLRPGDELEISYKTSQPAKIVVFAVNSGILQVAKYTLPKPLPFFFRKSALEIITYQTVDLILPDYKIVREAASIGGDDSEYGESKAKEKIAKNINPFSRKTDKPVVFWSKTLNSSTEFQTVKYKVPDYFNGEITVMAVAASKEQAGSAQKETIVKSPVIISPVAPLAAIEGDEFEASATVSNNIDGSKSAELEVWLETDEKFETLGVNNQKFDIKEGGEKTVKFKLKTLSKLGSGALTFKAKYKNEVFKSVVSVSARPAYVYQTRIVSGVSGKEKVKVEDFARTMYDEFAYREVSASYNPQIIFPALKRYFTAYPFGCTEQIISAAFPFIYGAASDRGAEQKYKQIFTTPQGTLKIPDNGERQNYKQTFITPQEQQTLFNETLSNISLRQQSSGGFSLWADFDAPVHAYATLYVLHFFTDAKELGYPVPSDILNKGKNWLIDYASGLPASFEDAKLKAYANYILTRNNYITTNNLIRIEEYLARNHKKWEQSITAAYLAACYNMLKDFEKAEKLINSYKPDAKDKFIFYSDYDSSSQRNAVYLYLCNKHFAENLNPEARSIADGLVKVILDGKYNTISASQTLLALLSYGASNAGLDANISISAIDETKKETPLTLAQDPFPYSQFDSNVKSFAINAPKSGQDMDVYYSVLQQGFDKTAKDYAKGIEISREYFDENGLRVKSAALGQIITVKIKVRASSNDNLSLAVVDLLPACFEIISGTQQGSYASCDAREDRMIFYPTVSKKITELTYKVKTVTKGKFTIPGIFATAMYDPEISALGKQEKIEILE
ncbi:MAG: alpha-2-macroglobulin family protein [Endomicrobium sp.]|jgi:uncharacterized protein YfaS (alpha-2-macroglobulin family)|nr:alpha-2-macroglobulin family protein [Endomicrobium sp.]